MNTTVQCECRRRGMNCSFCLNPVPSTAESFMPDSMSLAVQQQRHVETPHPSFSLVPSTNELQSCSAVMHRAYDSSLMDTTSNTQYQEQSVADFSSLRCSPALNTPESSTKIPSVGSWDDLRDFDFGGDAITCSSEDVQTIRAKSSRTVSRPTLNVWPSSGSATPSSAAKTPSSSGSELRPYIDTPSPASDNSSAASWQMLSLPQPKQKAPRINKRRQLNEEERKNAKTVRKMRACVRCRMFKLKVRNRNCSSIFSLAPAVLIRCSVMAATHALAAYIIITMREISI